MPAMQPVPEVLKFRIVWTVDGDPAAMTGHYFKYSGGPPSGTDCATMGSAAVSAGHTRFGPYALDTVGMAECEVTDLTSPTSAQGTGGTAWAGSQTSMTPPGAAVLVNHAIARRYRGGKPRTYLPLGYSEVITSDGFWSNALVSGVDTAWGEWVADVIAASSGCSLTNIVNVSYFDGFTNVPYGSPTKYRRVPTPRIPPVVDVITAHTTSKVIASQRRRNRDA